MKKAVVIQHMQHDGAGRFAELFAEAEHGEGAHGRAVVACWPHMPGMGLRTRMMWENFRTLTGV